MNLTRRILSVSVVLLLTVATLFSATLACFAADECAHSYSLDRYTGLRLCTKCGEACEHKSFSSGTCSACGLVCSHDWDYSSATSLCRLCGAICSDHSTRGLDFDCARCGKERNEVNKITQGSELIHDKNLVLKKVHAVSLDFNFTAGTKNTTLNVKNTSRDDNIYYSSSESAINGSDYFSFLTLVGKYGGSNLYLTFCSMWLDTSANKLYLVAANASSNKICEIKPGYEYEIKTLWEPITGKLKIEVYLDGEKVGTHSATLSNVPSNLTESTIRFGEAYNAKRIHIQKVAFEDIKLDYAFDNGVCRLCGGECTHSYNAGGHCDFCGVYGDPITFKDGSNGGGNESGNKNASKLGVNDGYYSNTSYTQCWDYRDKTGSLLGHDFVIQAKYTFNEYVFNSSWGNGTTAIIVISDGEVDSSNWRFKLQLFGENNVLELGNSTGKFCELELGKEYDIRIAVRTHLSEAGKYSCDAEVSVNGKLVSTESFYLTEANGISIRFGDHVTRQTRAKYNIASDFGIQFIDSGVEYIGMQEKEDANYYYDTTFDLRFVFGIDDIYLEDVGVNVRAEMTGSALYGDMSGDETLSSSNTVLTEILENGVIRKPGCNGAGYGGYYYMLVVEDIALDTDAEYTFTLSPYIKRASVTTKTFADTKYVIKVHFENGKLVSEFSEAEGSNVSINGLDAIAGVFEAQEFSIPATEDTYIYGTNKDTTYGTENELIVKGTSKSSFELIFNDDSTHRRAFIKFDISQLVNKKITAGAAYLTLQCTEVENSQLSTPLEVKSTSASWSESNAKYSSLKRSSATKIADMSVSGKGTVSVDITDYVNECIQKGTTTLNLVIDGISSEKRRVNFASRESGNGPTIKIIEAGREYTTNIPYTAENPWQIAMDSVTTWLDRWETIKANGTDDAQVISKISSEYAEKVAAATVSKTDGDNTKYTNYDTRLIKSLNGYTASTAELDLYDEYGGYTGGERYEATGFFYTKKIGDRWWVIDPAGYPHFRTACVQISHGSSPNQKAMTLAEYGTIANWAQAATDRMWEIGFNATGGWSDTDNLIKANDPLVQTTIIYTMSKYASANGLNESDSGSTELLYDIIPVFDPAFDSFADKTIKNGVAGYENSPYIYGWMSDNELPSSINMLDNSLNLDYTDERFIYSYATAWTFMYMKTGNVDVRKSDVTDELRKEYRAMVFDKYYEVVTSKFDKYDPNHMYLGCRLLGSNYKDEYVMRVSGYWSDIVTFNYYSVWEPESDFIANVQNWANAPFTVTEWYAKGMDVCTEGSGLTNESGAGWTVKTQADRGKFYQNYALQLLECKGCVGFDWFKYWDNDPEDLTADLSNRDSNKGILNGEGEEYTELINYMIELNTQKYNLINFFDARNATN